jgi:predicted short-subunit dehydrogenase-like oxidoreductase (DUF2520 family)
MKITLNIIGCGRLGKTLAFLWKRNKLVTIQAIYNSTIASANDAVAFIGEGTVCHSIAQFKPADIYLIATPDDQIATVCQQLVEQASPQVGSLVMHCSGYHSSECLNAVKSLQCFTASMHPLFGFSDPARDVDNFSGSYCSFEGDTEVLEQVSRLIKGIGGQLFLIEKQAKALYHVASVFASNYLVTLAAIAEDCYKKSGLASDLAKVLTHSLMQQSLHRIKGVDAAKNALTGPIQRGDLGTVKKHLETLQPFVDLQSIYKALGKATALFL